jgi:Rrf2 family protein
VHISAKADYAVRAMLTLAEAGTDERVTVDRLVTSQGLPRKFLEAIMSELRRAGLVQSRRGPEGGFTLARPANEVSVADVLRVIDGPLAEVRGLRPERAAYTGSAEHLGAVWVAARAGLRSVLEAVTLAHITSGELPPDVSALLKDPDVWQPH